MVGKKKIIVVGHAALDHVFRIEAFPKTATKVRSLEHFEGGGGSAANAAVAAARLGAEAHLWSRVGDDPTGQRIIAGLGAEGVAADNIFVHPGSRSSEAAVIVDGHGERFIVSERDHHMPEGAEWLPLEQIRDASAVVSDLRWFEGTEAAFREARRQGVPTVLDIDVGGGAAALKYLALTDYAIFSAPAFEAVLPDDDDEERLRHLLARGVRHAGVTRGAAGYLWRNASGAGGLQPAFKVQAVDSTGAGDAFHGAFAWGLSQGLDDTACAKVASAVAAIKCERLGARVGLPNRERLIAFLKAAGHDDRLVQDLTAT